MIDVWIWGYELGCVGWEIIEGKFVLCVFVSGVEDMMRVVDVGCYIVVKCRLGKGSCVEISCQEESLMWLMIYEVVQFCIVCVKFFFVL